MDLSLEQTKIVLKSSLQVTLFQTQRLYSCKKSIELSQRSLY
ncbi:hypothetical protein COO91_05000 [Nostoc flagelliforme CCNUN1]|uniref:Uncharacterized protein n=1 Tax=Nostoc flagelliforme CCNUN1 TaxID=2038116 RepID=A0A2K8SUD4_9NOSO|nr:hypothetical protein COO91_05000 [Nostoc flagelliforme CCNUN1]